MPSYTVKTRAMLMLVLMIVCMCGVLSLSATPAHAFSVSKRSITQPTKVKLKSYAKFSACLKYNNELEVGGFKMPVPVRAGLSIEIPQLFRQPSVTGHTHSYDVHVYSKSKSVTHKDVWRAQSQVWLVNPTDMKLALKAKAVTAGKGETYIGTRPLTKESDVNAEYNSFKAFTVKK